MTFVIFYSDRKRSKTDDKTHRRDVLKHICVMHLENVRKKLLFFKEEKMSFSQNVDRPPFKWLVIEKNEQPTIFQVQICYSVFLVV